MSNEDGLKSFQSTKPSFVSGPIRTGNQPSVASVDFSKNVNKVHSVNPPVSKARPTFDVHIPMATLDDETLSGLSDISSIPEPQFEGEQEDLTRESDSFISLQKKGM